MRQPGLFDADSAIDDISVSPLDRIKRTDQHGNEYWSGRDVWHVLDYASWQKIQAVYQDIYTSLCMEDTKQSDLVRTSKRVTIGYGAIREVEDWRLSRKALDRILSRVASHKPEAVRQLRRQSDSHFRIEAELGVVLLEFCEQANLRIESQYAIANYRFDFCIAGRLLIEIDELHHIYNANQKDNDALKDHISREYGFNLLRVQIPFSNIAKLCGTIFRLLTDDKTGQVERLES